MITTRSLMNQKWVDLNSPTKEEIDSLMLTQNIDPFVAKDLLIPTPNQHTKDAGEMVYLVLHLPDFKQHQITDDTQEIDFIISRDSLITARYDSIDALHFFAKQIEVSEILNKEPDSHLFFDIMREIYKSIGNELAVMEDWTKEIERNIFEGKEKDMVFAISDAGRNILNFKRIIEPHGTALEFLREVGKEKFDEKFVAEIKNLMEEWRHMIRIIDSQIDRVAELRETNNSMLSTKQNEIMKVLTIMAFITFPLSLIAAVFGMNTTNLPIVGSQYDFWIVIGIMLIATFVMFIFFRYKKWL